MTDELGAVVRAHEQQSAVQADQSGQDVDDPFGPDGACYVDSQALACLLVDDGQALDLLACGRGVSDEVVVPHHVCLEGGPC